MSPHCPAGRPPSAGQAGQTVPLVAVVLLFAALLGVGLVRVGGAAARRAGAQAAADAAALAGAADGEDAARRVAAANGAELISYRESELDARVEVRRSGVIAQAQARWGADPEEPDG